MRAPTPLNLARLDLSDFSVLLIEDNAHMRRIIRMILTSIGVRTIVEAEDGAVALDIYSTSPPDLIITDWLMPIIDGIELTRRIRLDESTNGRFSPIIMISAKSSKRDVIHARDAGVTEFMCKPVSAKGLYLRIANAIGNPREFVRTKTFFGPDRRRFVNPHYNDSEKRHLSASGTGG